MRTVGIEKATAVGTELFDDFLRSHWPLSDCLRRDGLRLFRVSAIRIGDNLTGGVLLIDFNALLIDQLRRVVGPQVLHYALRNQHERAYDANRQQHPKRCPRHVHPKVSDGLHLTTRYAPNERDSERDSYRGRSEVVIGETSHLRQITHRYLGNIALPVGIGCKRCRRIERRTYESTSATFARVNAWQMLRVQR